MEYKWESEDKQGKPLKKIFPLGLWPIFCLIFFPITVISLSYVYFHFQVSGFGLTEVLIAWLFALFYSLHYLIVAAFTKSIRIYSQNIHLSVPADDVHLGKYLYQRNKPKTKWVFAIFKFKEIKGCHFAGDEEKAIIITTNDNVQWRIRNRDMSHRQLGEVIRIIKKYAGSESGIPEDEFKKKKR